MGSLDFVEQDLRIADGGDVAIVELRIEQALRAERVRTSERSEFRSPPKPQCNAAANLGDCHDAARGADGQTWTRTSAARHAAENGGNPLQKTARKFE